MVTLGRIPAPGRPRQQTGQQVVAYGLAGPQAQLAARLGVRAKQLLYLLHPGQQLLGGRLQQAPLVVELKSGMHPIEQRGGELALQLLQRLGDGPLAEAELAGRAPRLPWRAMVANTLSCCRVSFMSFDFPKRLVQFI